MSALKSAAVAILFHAAPVAAAPVVVTDIAPVHSIVAALMSGVADPTLIVPPGASEHDHALRPSEASALEDADLVVWIGPELTPWLADPLDALAPDAARLTLLSISGLRLLSLRAGGPYESHEHGHEAEDPLRHEARHGHDHAEDGHGHEEHAEEHADPHVWLDPRNGAAIAAAVALTLAEIDPPNAAAYAANADAFAAEMQALEAEIAPRMEALRGRPYFVFHDAYQYFEEAFDLPAAGSVALSDAEAPRAARVAEIRARFERESVDCVFAEPQFEPGLIETIIEGQGTRTGSLDPIGAGLEPGPGLYPALLRGLADDLAACLGPPS